MKLVMNALYMALENEGGGSEYGNYQVTKLLIEAGAQPYPELFANTKEHKRESPYKQLLASPYSSKFLLEKLLEAGKESGLPKALNTNLRYTQQRRFCL